jgi:hypothetical protein
MSALCHGVAALAYFWRARQVFAGEQVEELVGGQRPQFDGASAGRPRSAAGLIPEAVVVVFDQVWPLEQRVVVARAGLGHSPQQAGDAP